MKKISVFTLVLIVIFFNNAKAQNTIDHYGFKFAIPKKFKALKINAKTYMELNEKEFSEVNINFFGIGEEEAIINDKSQLLLIGKPSLIKTYNQKNLNSNTYDKEMLKFVKTKCKNATSERQAMRCMFKHMFPVYFFIISDKLSGEDSISEDMIEEFKEGSGYDELLEAFEIEDENIDIKGNVKKVELLLDQNKDPIFYVNVEVKTPDWNIKWETNIYFFIHDNRAILFFGECVTSLSKKCHLTRNNMNDIIRPFKNIENTEKQDLLSNNKILIESVGGIYKAYKIYKMYTYLLLLL